MSKRNISNQLFAIVFLLLFSFNVNAKKRLPDLTITEISVNRNCQLVIKVRNNGPGKLPGYVYTKHTSKSAGVLVSINGKKWGGSTIRKFDSGRKLQNPGGAAEYISSYKVSSAVKVWAVVDKWDNVKEDNENNNTKSVRKIDCVAYSKKLPDLTVKKISLTKTGKIKITIANIGSAGVPASYYENPNAVAVQMYNGKKPWGGLILKGVDPQGKLKNPGGVVHHVWFPSADNLNLGFGKHTIKVIVDVHKNLMESNETNNAMIKKLKRVMTITKVKQHHAGECMPEIDIQGFGFGNSSTNLAVKFGNQTIQQIPWWSSTALMINLPPALAYGGQTYPVQIVNTSTNTVLSNTYNFLLLIYHEGTTPASGKAGDTIQMFTFLMPANQGNHVLMIGNTFVNNIVKWKRGTSSSSTACLGEIVFKVPSGIAPGNYPIYIKKGGQVVSNQNATFTVQ